MVKMKLKWLHCAVCLLLLTGCWDRVEINDLAFVTATGVDKEEENKFRVSCQIPLPGAMGGAGSSGGGGGTAGAQPFYVDSGTGRNIKEANDNLQLRMSRNLYFAHRRVIVFGKELAKSGFKKSLDVILVQPQSRISTFVLISENDALGVLDSSPHLEQLPAEAIRELTKNSLNITVKEVLQDIDRPGKDPLVPIVEVIKTQNKNKEQQTDEIELKKIAILKDDNYKFETTPKESLGIFWLKEMMEGKTLTFSISDKDEVNVEVERQSLIVDYEIKNDLPTFNLNIKAATILVQNENNVIIAKEEIYKDLKEKLDKTIEDQILTIINKAKAESADIYGFGWLLYRKDPLLWKGKFEDKWDDILKELDVKVNVDTEIRRLSNTGIDVED